MKPPEIDPTVEYARRAGPDSWADYAGELKSAIDILWQQEDQSLTVSYDSSRNPPVTKKPSISRTWLLVAAFAIENLIKGNIVALHPEYISNGKLSKKVAKHKLTDLASSIDGFSLDEEERNLLQLLEELLPSWGRYPVPKQASELVEEGILTHNTQATFQKLFDKLDLHLYDKIKNGWDGPHNLRFGGSYRTDIEGMIPTDLPLGPQLIRKWKAEQETSTDT